MAQLQPSYVYETDPKSGLPRLHSAGGPACGWTNKEVEQIEEHLRLQYASLALEGGGTLEIKGRTVYVRRRAGDVSRQPTLELLTADPAAAPPVPLTAAPPAIQKPVSWFAGFETTLAESLASVRGNALDEPDKAMIELVLKELRRIHETRSSGELAAIFLGAVTLLAERLKRGNQPAKSTPYTFALTGIEKLLDPAGTPWGSLPTAPTSDPPPSWFARLWAGLRG